MVLGTYVTEQQIAAMTQLERFKEKHGKGMTVSELAHALGDAAHANINQMLHRMMAKGFVQRKLDTSAPRKRLDGISTGSVAAWRWTVTATGRKWL